MKDLLQLDSQDRYCSLLHYTSFGQPHSSLRSVYPHWGPSEVHVFEYNPHSVLQLLSMGLFGVTVSNSHSRV